MNMNLHKMFYKSSNHRGENDKATNKRSLPEDKGMITIKHDSIKYLEFAVE